MITNAKLKAMAQEQKKKTYIESCQGSEYDVPALGILIARGLDLNGVLIMEAFAEALEDANFHEECGIVREMMEKYS